MQKAVDCRYWKEYQGLNGWIMFCSAGAFAGKLAGEEAAKCGCTPEKRAVCARIMESSCGYALLPELEMIPAETEKAAAIIRPDSKENST